MRNTECFERRAAGCLQRAAAGGLPLWVTFPFDVAAPDAQPEVLARVVRRYGSPVGEPVREEIALHFERFPLSANNAREVHQTAAAPPVKNGSVGNVSVPIRVRPRHILWPEEAMTLDVSNELLRIPSATRICAGRHAVSFVRFERDANRGRNRRKRRAEIVKVEKECRSRPSLVLRSNVLWISGAAVVGCSARLDYSRRV